MNIKEIVNLCKEITGGRPTPFSVCTIHRRLITLTTFHYNILMFIFSISCISSFPQMIIATYGVSLVWLVTIVVMSMAFTFMMMVRAYCKGSVPENPPNTQCLDLAQYGKG